MRVLFVMVVVALALVSGAAAGDDAPMLDGKWLIVYAEEGGRRNNAWEQRVAVLQGDTLSYQAEQKRRSLQLKLGPNQTLSAAVQDEEGSSRKHQGVYIAAQDYLCLSLVTGAKKHSSSGDFILILRRQREK